MTFLVGQEANVPVCQSDQIEKCEIVLHHGEKKCSRKRVQGIAD